MSLNDDIADDMTDLAVEIARLTKALQMEIAAMLDELAQEVESLVRASKLGDTPLTTRKTRELEQNVATVVNAKFAAIAARSAEVTAAAAKLSQDAALSAMTTIIGPTGKPLTLAELRALSKDPVVPGNRMSTWWKGQADSTTARFIAEMRQGIMNSETNEQIVRRLVGTKLTGTRVVIRDGKEVRIKLRSGGVLALTELQAEALVRTSANAVASETLRQIYDENSDIIRGVALIVTLDHRTSLICISLADGAWDLEGDPLPDSAVQIPFPGYPPYHMRCRTIPVPVTKSWAELGAHVKFKVPEGTRASMDGQIPAKTTFEEWLRRKSPEFQKELLGKGRYELWKSGKITRQQFTTERLRPRTVKQLEQL